MINRQLIALTYSPCRCGSCLSVFAAAESCSGANFSIRQSKIVILLLASIDKSRSSYFHLCVACVILNDLLVFVSM